RVIGSVKVKRIDLVGFHEFQNFHGAGRGRIKFVELLFAEENVLIFLVFESLDDFGALDLAIASGAELRLANARVAHGVELVQTDAVRARGRKQPYRDRDQAESEMALPDRSRHKKPPAVYMTLASRQRVCKVTECPRRMQGEE